MTEDAAREVAGDEPYTIVGPLRRFDRRYTAFARAEWDPTCLAYGTGGKRAAEEREPRPGYGPQEYALHAGAWAIARARLAQEATREAEEAEAAPVALPEREADPAELTARVKRAARFFGAALVGITRVNPLWLYANDAAGRPITLPAGVDTAVVMAIEMDYAMIGTSPSVVAAAATGAGYSQMAYATRCLTRYLRSLGWRAIPSGNDFGLSIPLAIDAGLGELGRNGLLITERFGPRVRLCKVFTDAPLLPDAPRRFGVREFCQVCLKCVKTCPSGSISDGEMTAEGPTPSNNPGVLKWYINPEKCLAFWRAQGASCANCIRACPFNKPEGWLHDLARRFVRLGSGAVNRALVALDDLLRYGRQADPERFWNSAE